MIESPHVRVFRSWPALLVLLAGCAIFGGQGTDDAGEACPEVEREIDDDQAGATAGFAPADVLPWVLGERKVSAQWNAPPNGIETSSAAGPVEVAVSIERARGAAVEVVPATGGAFNPTSGCAAPHLRVPVAV